MADWAETHTTCPCGKSSDAYSVNTDGWGTCYSCNETFPPDSNGEPRAEKQKVPKELVQEVEIMPLRARKISEETARKFGYGYGFYKGERVQVAPYCDTSGKVVAQKVRTKDKDFRVTGKMPGTLFGQQLWQNKNGRKLIVTEGEIDAMSVYEVLSTKWPCVSLPSGCTSAAKVFKENIEFLESFQEVVLCFDQDEPGQKAVSEVVDLLTPGKVKVATLPMKDANECLLEGAVDQLIQSIWQAKVHRPDGVLNAKDLRQQIHDKVTMGLSYPWTSLNKITYGQHEGRLVTWTAGSGLGKSAFVREVAYNLGVEQGVQIGYIGLEENVAYTARTMVGLHLNKPIHLPDVVVTKEEIDQGFDETLGKGMFWFYDHFGSISEASLFSKMKYMAAMGCKFIVLDHLTIVLSGLELDNERQAIDQTMTKLRSFCEQTGVGLHLVSHLKRPEGRAHEEGGKPNLAQLRGSHSIVQLSDFIIALQRNSAATDPEERNRTMLWVLKNRLSGETGLGCVLQYSKETGRLYEVDWVLDENGEVMISPDTPKPSPIDFPDNSIPWDEDEAF